MNITKHFTIEEMTYSATALRLGIDNSLPSSLMPNVLCMCKALEIIRTHYAQKPIIVTSCYRGVELNKAIGGSSNSFHMKALAVDFHIPGISILDLCLYLPSIIPSFDQIIYEFGPTGWAHLGLGNTRGELLTATKLQGKTIYSKGISR